MDDLRSHEVAIRSEPHVLRYRQIAEYLSNKLISGLSLFQTGITQPTSGSPSSEPKVEKAKVKATKERINYASFDCTAAVLQANPQAKGATAILVESKDKYMWNECATEKFIVVELCDDILVDTVALANYEFFSSNFKDVRISVSDTYPPRASAGWKVLGEFQARNVRDIQVFQISNPFIWARFLRLDFLSHYGNEFLCPVSLLRVHGTTMIEEYRREGDEISSDAQKQSSLPLLEAEASSLHSKTEVPIMTDLDNAASDAAFHKLRSVIDGGVSSLAPHHQSQIEDSTNLNKHVLTKQESRQNTGSQESIFKTITKRLNILEQRISLSYKYLSEQSSAINEVFASIDATQREYLREALLNLNETTTIQLNILNNTYELVWQAAVHESKLYRESTDEKIEEITRQIHILADEVAFERRLGVVQLLLLVVLIVIVTSSNLIKDPLKLIKRKLE
ncbi:hypothetical protein K493DRAFT_275058 [Basidiobolus meristosporus CBS 931.73]|uniref:SUN-like protein 1 n=1 Tax=Basidiobolus meristosporus CBS 931.73 TaxID=1314790 RepID=A0A1Y1Z581_9FUNG|nr:hypothetical protein K493DRAFT_275058 [Basidiobolus meristosporus CBS 931.73]|eukprot:ORY05448.1 hypothetical protein K493DRAFT_275058 [Basidiobolus meristosporus CBS 931.73]